MRTTLSTIVAISALLTAPSAFAHHSFAPHFDSNKPVSISGTITAFEAQNPHSYVHIAAVDENGRTQKYVCESHGVTQLTRNGVTPQILKVGTKIRVTGSLSRHSPYMCFFNTVELADGRVLNVNGPTGPRPATAPLPARKDIFGTWMLAPIPNRSTSGPQPMIQLMTPAGEKAVAAYDPFKDDPTFRCDPVAIRRVWGAPGTPLEIVREGTDVVLRHEWMDVRRVIHMNMKEHPKNGPRSSLGHSIGHWEGDTLVIETANFTGKTRFRGSTDQLRVTERFTRADERTLLYRFTVDDPATWTRPWTGEYPWVLADEPLYEYACHEGNYAFEGIMKGARLLEKEAAERSRR
jgi:hypothetical protein